MLAVFDPTVAKCPEGLRSPPVAGSAAAAAGGAGAGALMKGFSDSHDGAVTVSLGPSGALAYSAANQNPLVPRCCALLPGGSAASNSHRRTEGRIQRTVAWGSIPDATEISAGLDSVEACVAVAEDRRWEACGSSIPWRRPEKGSLRCRRRLEKERRNGDVIPVASSRRKEKERWRRLRNFLFLQDCAMGGGAFRRCRRQTEERNIFAPKNVHTLLFLVIEDKRH
jgi:hypothetical protein